MEGSSTMWITKKLSIIKLILRTIENDSTLLHMNISLNLAASYELAAMFLQGSYNLWFSKNIFSHALCSKKDTFFISIFSLKSHHSVAEFWGNPKQNYSKFCVIFRHFHTSLIIFWALGSTSIDTKQKGKEQKWRLFKTHPIKNNSIEPEQFQFVNA